MTRSEPVAARRRGPRTTALVASATVLLVLTAACTPPPARPAPYARVLLVADSLMWGSAFIAGNPQLMPHLQPMLAARGIDVRIVGGSAETPLEQSWPSKVHAEVSTWDPDLVIIASVIPTPDVREHPRRLAVGWSMTAFQAASRGAEVWRVEPPELVPGTWYDARYSPDLAALRSIQAFGTRVGAPDRATTVDLGPTLRDCPDPRTADGLHLTDAGQQCVATQLTGLITAALPPR